MANPVIRNIVSAWLQDNGYDGLFQPDTECGCILEGLMVCDNPNADECEAGHNDPKQAVALGGSFWISRRKPGPNPKDSKVKDWGGE